MQVRKRCSHWVLVRLSWSPRLVANQNLRHPIAGVRFAPYEDSESRGSRTPNFLLKRQVRYQLRHALICSGSPPPSTSRYRWVAARDATAIPIRPGKELRRDLAGLGQNFVLPTAVLRLRPLGQAYSVRTDPFDAPTSASPAGGDLAPHVVLPPDRLQWMGWGSNPLVSRRRPGLQPGAVPLRRPIHIHLSERLKGLEPLTLALARRCSTTELQPHINSHFRSEPGVGIEPTT